MSQANPTDAQANAYAENYVLYGDQSRAWRVTFTSSKCKPETVHYKASLFHKNEKVQKRIDELNVKTKNIAEDKFTVTIEQRIKWLDEVARAGLEVIEDNSGASKRQALASTCKAIEVLNTMLGIDEKAGSIKPVKVFIGVQDAS